MDGLLKNTIFDKAKYTNNIQKLCKGKKPKENTQFSLIACTTHLLLILRINWVMLAKEITGLGCVPGTCSTLKKGTLTNHGH